MKRKVMLAVSAVVLVMALAYSRYFGSDLHFGDYPSTRDNPAIRSLLNIPRFFYDTSTSSIYPPDYVFRPLVTTSFALDYFVGRGHPFAFHLSAFLILLCGLVMIGWLYFAVFERTQPHPWNVYLAVMATALFALHPALAEILNPLTARGELFADLGVVAGIALYAGLPNTRRFGLYLLPPALGILAHPNALVFGPLLLVYILLVQPAPSKAQEETFTDEQLRSRDQTVAPIQTESVANAPRRIRIRRRKHPFRHYLKEQLKRFTPALLFTAAAGTLQWFMKPFELSADAMARYAFTQMWVAWLYFRSFFAPYHLAPYNDLTVFTYHNVQAVEGMTFLLALISLAVLLGVSQIWRPVYFGICWFIVSLLPAVVFMPGEVESDTRMFLPFVGLALAITWTARVLLPQGEPLRRLEAIVAAGFLLAFAYGAYARNRVWSDEEVLWHDTVEKHPASVRALENYALVLTSKGQPQAAYDYLWRAFQLSPGSAEVEANLATAAEALNRPDQAEEHFHHARSLAADPTMSYLPYATWLEKQGRKGEALDAYSWASTLAPTDLRPRYGMMRIYAATYDWDNLRHSVEDAQKIAPGDAGVAPFASLARQHPDSLKEAEQLVRREPTPDHYLALSDNYCAAGEYLKCREAAEQSLKLRPKDAYAYNNIAQADVSLGLLDDALTALNKALQADPENKVARANLVNLIDWQHQQHEVVTGQVATGK